MARHSSSHKEPPVQERDTKIACMLILAKILILPTACLCFYFILSGSACDQQCSIAAVAAFIYGTFPSAPSVGVFAGKYGISTRVRPRNYLPGTQKCLEPPDIVVMVWEIGIYRSPIEDHS